MKPLVYASLAAGLLCPLTSIAAPAVTAAIPAPAAKASSRITGLVTAVDAAKRTLTVSERRTSATTALVIAPDAAISTTGAGTLASLKVGDTVAAYGTATPDAPTLTATRIAVLPPARAPKKAAARTAGFHAKRVEGVVATTTPTLTLTTPGKITVTVNTSAATTVETMTPGSLSDILVGKTVAVRLEKGTTVPTASEISVQPDRKGRAKAAKTAGKKKGKKGAQASALTPLAP